MRLQADIPTKAQLINGGFECKTAAKGQPGAMPDLGEYSDKKGVYIFHSAGKLLYVGKTTDGVYGNFRDRLYRHVSESASNSSRIYKLLSEQKAPIKVYLLDLEDINMMIDPGSVTLDDVNKALIMEQILIGVFSPTGNDPKAVNDG
jgi:hypothetical protein